MEGPETLEKRENGRLTEWKNDFTNDYTVVNLLQQLNTSLSGRFSNMSLTQSLANLNESGTTGLCDRRPYDRWPDVQSSFCSDFWYMK